MRSQIVFLFMEVIQLVLNFLGKLTKDLGPDLKKDLGSNSYFLFGQLVLSGACFDQGYMLADD